MKIAAFAPVLGALVPLVLLGACGGTRSGVPATLLHSPTNPLVAVRILFHVGSMDDPQGKEGLAALTAAMIAEGGSSRLSYKQLLDALYPMAASIGVRADKEVTVIAGTIHRDNLEAYYELLRQVLLEPRFDPADFERLKSDQLNYLENVLRAADDENLGKETLEAAMYAGHPYGWPVAGTVSGIRAITLDDVKTFHASRFTRDQCELGLAGGYPEAFAARVEADLGSLPGGRPSRRALPTPRRPDGIEVTVVTKPTRAWAISIGYPIGVTRSDGEFYALMVANSYLGEHRTFNGVLMNKLRGDRGLNYGDYSYIESFIQQGGSTFPLSNIPRRQQFFSIWIRPVAGANAHFAIRAAFLELDRLVREGMTEAQFEATRDFLLNYSRLWTQTAARRLGYEMDGRFYGCKSLVDEVQVRLPDLTVAEVNAAIRKHLQADDAYVAVVANEEEAGEFAKALEADRPSPITYDTETRPEVVAEDEQVAAYPLRVNAQRLRIVPAKGDGSIFSGK